MWKKPSSASIIIIVIFLIINPLRFQKLEGNIECIRFFEHEYNWKIFIPIFYFLLLFSLFEIWRLRRKWRENILTILLVAPVILHEIYFLFNMLRSLLSNWRENIYHCWHWSVFYAPVGLCPVADMQVFISSGYAAYWGRLHSRITIYTGAEQSSAIRVRVTIFISYFC